MPWLLPILTKIAWWLLPKLIGRIVDAISTTLALVATAEAAYPENLAARRDYVIQRMPGCGIIPETALRFLLEFCVILHGLGITNNQMDRMEELVSQQSIQDLTTSSDKRNAVLKQFAEMFPDVPERAGRLLLQIAVAKLRGAVK